MMIKAANKRVNRLLQCVSISLLSCSYQLVSAQTVDVVFQVTLQGAGTGLPADGFNFYLGCDDPANKTLLSRLAEGVSQVPLTIPNGSSLHFCAAGFITDASGKDNEGPLIFADPIVVSLIQVPEKPKSIEINVLCDQVPAGWQCSVSAVE